VRTFVTRRKATQQKAGLIAAPPLLAPGLTAACGDPEPPRLVLQIMVDALLGDLPERYARRSIALPQRDLHLDTNRPLQVELRRSAPTSKARGSQPDPTE